MKFLADMGISSLSVGWLRDQGHDALHAREAAMQRAPDEDFLEKARNEDRVLLTLDLDFGYLMAISGERLPSIIIFRLGNKTAEYINARLEDVLACCADRLREGAIISVEEAAIRIRQLPIEKE
jgi:predicted nuclease of predicted toxin-antitoxin system